MSWLGRICTYEDLISHNVHHIAHFAINLNLLTMELTRKLVVMDLNHRSYKRQIYSLLHLTTLETTIRFLLKQPFEKRWGGLAKASIILMERQ